MRIVSGKYKGRVLCEFDGDRIRPTGDKVRESLFNILQFKVFGSSFLDLFCGTGAMGIEALSRGAKNVVFNDYSKDSLNLLKKNLAKLKVDEQYSVKNFDAVTYLEGTSDKFDIVYIDPPYASDLGERALKVVCRVLTDDGIVILEGEREFCESVSDLTVYDKRKYGRAYLTFFKKGETL